MCFFFSLIPATIWVVLSYFILYSSTKTQGALQRFGYFLPMRQDRPLSAVTPIADKGGRGRIVRLVPIANSCTAANSISIQSPRRRGRVAVE